MHKWCACDLYYADSENRTKSGTKIDKICVLLRTAFKDASNFSELLECGGNLNSILQVDAEMSEISSTLNFIQPGRKATVANLHSVSLLLQT